MIRLGPVSWFTVCALICGQAAAKEPASDAVVAAADVPHEPATDVGTADGAGDDLGDGPPAAEVARELQSVEEEVTDLKERVFRSKATLKLLEELVVDSSISGARLVLWHQNDLGGGYSLQSAEYFLDGRSVYSRIDPEGSLDEAREIKVLEQTLTPGEHTLEVNLVLRGNGFQVFSYVRDYQFNVNSSYAFDVEDGRISVLRVIAESRGAFRTFEERPTVRYDEHIENYSEE